MEARHRPVIEGFDVAADTAEHIVLVRRGVLWAWLARLVSVWAVAMLLAAHVALIWYLVAERHSAGKTVAMVGVLVLLPPLSWWLSRELWTWVGTYRRVEIVVDARGVLLKERRLSGVFYVTYRRRSVTAVAARQTTVSSPRYGATHFVELRLRLDDGSSAVLVNVPVGDRISSPEAAEAFVDRVAALLEVPVETAERVIRVPG